jgi:hypothetical protein
MRENRTYGSEGGEADAFPTPIKPRGNAYLAMRRLARFWAIEVKTPLS